MNKKGFSPFGTIGKAILMVVVLVVAVVLFTGLAGGSGGKLGDLSSLVTLPSKPPVIETGALQLDDVCRFSYDCAIGLACWKKSGEGGSGQGNCVKSIDTKLIEIDGKHVTKAGSCYASFDGLVKDWINTGQVPRKSNVVLTPGKYVLEAGNDAINIKKGVPQIAPTIVLTTKSSGGYTPDLLVPKQSWVSSVHGTWTATGILPDRTYVLYVYDTEFLVYGAFEDSNCDDNSGYNSIRIDKLSEHPYFVPSVP